MALPKFPKTKSFHVDYCGCTAATSLLNENLVQESINSIRCTKSKRDFVKATISTYKDGIRIIYENKEKYSTHVPASMIACSAISETSYRDTVGVVYISPLTGRHYPAFVHVYHCESSRTAQKLLNRLRYYTKIENHHSDLVKLERQLLEHDLLNINRSQTSNLPIQKSESTTSTSSKTNTGISSSSSNSNSRPEKMDPVKSITEEFQRKIKSKQPILFPPKDYDTFHAEHGNIQRAHGWKSTQPSIVGDTKPHTPHQDRRKTPTSNQNSSIPPTKLNEFHKRNFDDDFLSNGERSRLSMDKNDHTMDPVETVSLAFEFLKDETGSMFNGSDGNIEHFDVEESTKSPIFRFRPAPIAAINKNAIHQRSNYELNLNGQQAKQQANNGMDSYYNKAHHQCQLPYSQRTRSETTVETRSRPGMLLSPRYESRLASGSGVPISTNPLWIGMTPSMAGSQPNLLSPQTSSFQHPLSRHLSPAIPRRSVDVPLEHPLYAIHQDNRLAIPRHVPIISIKRPAPGPPLSASVIHENTQRRQTTHFPHFNTNEFILRASDNQILKNLPNPNRPISELSKDHGLPLRTSISHSTTMLDVYY